MPNFRYDTFMLKRILVTGGSAVAGNGLKSVIQKGEYSGREFIFPNSKELNLLDFEATKKFFSDWKPDGIIHFAAISGGIQLTLEHPASVMRDNIFMNFNVAEAARATTKPKIVFTSSAAAYPLDAPLPMKEESMHAGYPHKTNYGYAFAKRLLDPIVKSYRKEFGMNFVGMIPGAILGPRSNFNPASSTAVPGMIRRFYENRDNNDPLVVWGDGSPVRQFTSDEDIGRIAMWFLDNYEGDELLNVSTAEETSIKEAAQMIIEFFKLNPERLSFDASKPPGTHSQSIDNSKFIALSQFSYTPTRETIRRTAEYFSTHYPDSKMLRL